jgi:tetratricopeptide (TPR) repeat protein
MPRMRNRWLRLLVVAVILAVIGVAAYRVAFLLWASHHHSAALADLERYDFEEAGDHLEKYLSVHPKDGDALLLAAQTARRRGEFDKAGRQLHMAEEHGASAEAVATERQLLRVHAGDLSGADPLVQYCTNHPSDPQAALVHEALIEGSLTALYTPLAKWAIDLWLKHRTSQVEQVQGLVWRGRVYEFLQEQPQAMADFRKAVELGPDHFQARLRLAEALIREAPHEAVPHLDWLRGRRPNHPHVRLLSASLYRNLGQPEEAAKLLDELLVATPDKVAVLVERAKVAMDMHRLDDAERWLRRALLLAPMQRAVNLTLSDCLRQAGRLDEAKRYQERVDEIDATLHKKLEEMTRKAKATP